MGEPFSRPLQLWEGGLLSVSGQRFTTAASPTSSSPRVSNALSELFAAEVFLSAGAPITMEDGAEPGSLQWFLTVEHIRLRRNGRWIPAALEFSKHAGETLLGLGPTLGTDWVQYASHGASVIASCASSDQLSLMRRNFELRQLSARFVHAPPTRLPIESSSIDVVCVTNLLEQSADAAAILDEVYRVLKPGGKVVAVVPAKYDIDFWQAVLLPWRWWARRKDTEQVRYSARRLRSLFTRFVDHRVHKRHLRRADVPHTWRLLPTSMLERMVGRLHVVKAFKPLSSAMHVPMAA